MRLIDKDELKSAKFKNSDHLYRLGWNDAIDAIIECAPIIDATEVIRCENCKHCEIIDYYTTRGEKYIITYRCMKPDGVFKNEDDFCSCGERKEE